MRKTVLWKHKHNQAKEYMQRNHKKKEEKGTWIETLRQTRKQMQRKTRKRREKVQGHTTV